MMSTWSLFTRYAKPRAGSVAVLLMLALMAVGIEALLPWPLKIIVDHVLASQPLPQGIADVPVLGQSPGAILAWMAGAMLVLLLMHQVIQMLKNLVQATLATRMQFALASDVLEHLQSLSLSFHTRSRRGDLARRVTSDTDSIATLLTGVLVPLLAALVALIVLFAIMWRLDQQLALVAGCVALPMAVVIRLFGQRMAQRAYEHQQSEGELWSVTEQTLTALPVVQAFGRELHGETRFRGAASRTRRAYLRNTATQLLFRIGVDGCEAIGIALVLLIGGYKVLGGTLSVGTLIVFLSYLAALYAPLLEFANLSTTTADAIGGARRVLEVLRTDEMPIEHAGARPLPVVDAGQRGHIRIEDVYAAYRPDTPVLRGVSIELHPGESVALVGATGAGKSTLMALVPRLIDPTHGRVVMDGHDVRDVTLASLRQRVSMVLQDPFILPLSIAQNIRFGKPDATDAQVVEAARMAHADEFIIRLPNGYDTVVGERGATLSGGQRQRLAIARALVKDAPVLLLDEPTSALDMASEALVMNAIERLMRGRTTLLIAHRLSTAARADRIIVLDQGTIIETGSYAELIAARGMFHQLWQSQAVASSATPAPSEPGPP